VLLRFNERADQRHRGLINCLADWMMSTKECNQGSEWHDILHMGLTMTRGTIQDRLDKIVDGIASEEVKAKDRRAFIQIEREYFWIVGTLTYLIALFEFDLERFKGTVAPPWFDALLSKGMTLEQQKRLVLGELQASQERHPEGGDGEQA
jgi:hypothetical protein